MSTATYFPIIEGFWIKNYKGLKQISFGSSIQQMMVADVGGESIPYELTPITIFIGQSGIGKSTILDMFSFLSDCLNLGLDEAVQKRGGFDDIYHRGGEGPISFGVVFRACAEPIPLTYAVTINKKPGTNHAYFETEAILYRDIQQGGVAKTLLLFQNGEKTVRYLMPWKGAFEADLEKVKHTDARHLALATLGNYEDIPDIPQLKQHLNRFYYSCYRPDNTAGLTPLRYKPIKGGSLLSELKQLKEKFSFEFPSILNVAAKRLPGIESISCEITEVGRMVLTFIPTGGSEPFQVYQMSEGLLRLFSHLLLFEDSIPSPLIGIEEPAAYMDDVQIKAFAETTRTYVNEMGGTQYLMTTNQIALVDQMDPSDVWILFRDTLGEIKANRAIDELMFQGVDLNSIGPYWYSDYFYRKSR